MSNSKSILIIVLLVIIVAGLIGVNVYLWNYHSKLVNVQPITELTNFNSEIVNTNQTEIVPETAKEFTMADIIEIVKNKLPEKVAYWKRLNPNFSWQDFAESTQPLAFDQSQARPVDYEISDQLKAFYDFSPQDDKFVNVHVNGFSITKVNDQSIVRYTGFDDYSAVNFVDLNKKTELNILSCGTVCGFDEVLWLDNDNFIVLGSNMIDQEENGTIYNYFVYPAIYFYNLKTGIAKQINGPAYSMTPDYDLTSENYNTLMNNAALDDTVITYDFYGINDGYLTYGSGIPDSITAVSYLIAKYKDQDKYLVLDQKSQYQQHTTTAKVSVEKLTKDFWAVFVLVDGTKVFEQFSLK